MLKECILAAAIVVSPGQTKKLASPNPEKSTIESGFYEIQIDKIISDNFDAPFTAVYDFGSGNTSYKAMVGLYDSDTGFTLYYAEGDYSEASIYLILDGVKQENNSEYFSFHVDEKQTFNTDTFYTAFMTNYVLTEEPPSFSLTTIFTELAEGLKNLALGFVNAFSGLGPIFYNDGLTIVSIFLIGGVALTIGFWAIDKIFGLAKMGLGSLGKARANKSKKKS